jgi:hypothetical protein
MVMDLNGFRHMSYGVSILSPQDLGETLTRI